MPDEALQAAFEIQAACDDISRKLLRYNSFLIGFKSPRRPRSR